jgi:transposase
MRGFVRGADRQQTTLLPECLDDWVDESNSIRAVDVFMDALELRDLGFDGVDPAATGRPAYHPSPMLKLYIYGYLNRVQSSRRLEREAEALKRGQGQESQIRTEDERCYIHR